MQPRTEWDDIAGGSTRAVSPGIRLAIDFIEENYAQPIPLSHLAALAGLSLHRFVTVFRGQVGIPPYQFVCRVRIREARALLSRGMKPASVALDTGFFDQSHLSRHFKRQCGVTPGHFASAGRFAGLDADTTPTGSHPCD